LGKVLDDLQRAIDKNLFMDYTIMVS